MIDKKIKDSIKNAVMTAINCKTSDEFCNVLGIENNEDIKGWWKSFCNPIVDFFNFARKSTNCDINAFAYYMSNETIEALETAIMETNGEDFIIQLFNDNDIAAHSVMAAVNMGFMELNDLNIHKNELMGYDRIG